MAGRDSVQEEDLNHTEDQIRGDAHEEELAEAIAAESGLSKEAALMALKGKSNFKIQNVKLFDPTIILPSLLEK